MDKPQRVQLSRAKGWRMPPDTVKVDRATRWGNPFRSSDRSEPSLALAVAEFERWIMESAEGQRMAAEARTLLRGKNLACWCKAGGPCHAEVLITVANIVD